MTDEEYLRACGWVRHDMSSGKPRWQRWAGGRRLSLAEAVEMQLAEDRARFAFVLARTPQPEARSCDPGFFVEAPDVPTITTPEDARRLFGEPMYEPGGAPSNASAAAIEALKMQRPVVAVKVESAAATVIEEPPDSGPVNDLAAVAVRINNHLNHLWFEETGRALASGIQRPGAYAEDGLVFVSYDAFCGITFAMSERVARAYDAWLAAGNVGKHYDGDTLRPGIEVKR